MREQNCEMKQIAVSLLFCLMGLLASAGFAALMPPAYPRIGLYAGLGTGLIFGVSVPVEIGAARRLIRAVRSSLAFSLTVGIGYAFYMGLTVGVAWGVGGLIGCVTGCLSGQIGRGFMVTESPRE